MSRYALLVGINYFNTPNQLYGCINDIIMVRKYLIEKRGYLPENIKVLRDDSANFSTPTRVNIINALNELVNKSKISNCDEIFFHYSGHGTWIKDTVGDEDDGQTECICPSDLNLIEDNDIRIILENLNNNVPMMVIMDCCHSGTNMDLPYKYGVKTDKISLIKNTSKVDKELLEKNIFQISGCRDDQTSADVYKVYKPIYSNNPDFCISAKNCSGGALTCSILNSLAKNIDFVNCLPDIYDQITKNSYTQLPQLSSTKDIIKLEKDGKLPVTPKPIVPQTAQIQSITTQPVKPQPVKPQPIKPQSVKPQSVKPQPVKPQPVKSNTTQELKTLHPVIVESVTTQSVVQPVQVKGVTTTSKVNTFKVNHAVRVNSAKMIKVRK